MLDDFGQRIRDIILSEMDLSRELSDEEICDLIGSVVSREARDRPMTIKDTFYFFAFFEKVIKKLLTFCYW